MKRLFLLLSLLLFLFAGCARQEEAGTDERHLKISAAVEEGLGFTTFPADELGGLTEDLSYLDLKDVTIELDGATYPLEAALREGRITVEEIFANARLDARKGLCGETHESEHGLTHFTYYYPEFYLHLVYDVYEAPDGSSHLISDMTLYQPGSSIGFFYADEKTGTPLTQEDWGLAFQISEVTPTGLKVSCKQSSGQQIGHLLVEWYTLTKAEGENPDWSNPGESPFMNTPLTMDGETTFSLDWSESHGVLPSGEYCLVLNITDCFDESQVHPLMEDFHDRQVYDVFFTIP